MFNAAVVTVSDRSFRGERPDGGGPLVASMLKEAGYAVAEAVIVPDEQAEIEAVLCRLADSGTVQLIVTTGGTGFAPRDVTPEATLAVCDRLTPGIPEAMRYASLQVTSRAMLSRGPGGHPGRGAHRQPPRLPQGREGESGGRPPRPLPRTGDALGPSRRLCQPDGLTALPPYKTGAAEDRGACFMQMEDGGGLTVPRCPGCACPAGP